MQVKIQNLLPFDGIGNPFLTAKLYVSRFVSDICSISLYNNINFK